MYVITLGSNRSELPSHFPTGSINRQHRKDSSKTKIEEKTSACVMLRLAILGLPWAR